MKTEIRCATPTTLMLIRHGESQANLDRCFGGHSDTPLTEDGHGQAKLVASYLRASISRDSLKSTRLYSSDLPRAWQTAEPIAEALELELVAMPGLRERSVGDLDGQPFDVAKRQRPELWKGLLSEDPNYRPPGGESAHEAHARMRDCLQLILQANEGGQVLAVTHGIVSYLGINALLGFTSGESLQRYFALDNTSRSTFVVGPRRTRITGINQLDHLR